LSPKVSFVVPCYKFGHLLEDCVRSILSQSCPDLEILIMDDCSPDNTPEVGRALAQLDPRVRYIRNEPNLGHLRNYNKGIDLARGEYIWLISADDRLRRPYALQRYLDVMERRPEIGFACCPAIEMDSEKETKLAEYSVLAERDIVFPSEAFYEKLITHNPVIAAAGLVRKACYEKCGAFPLDLPYAGDWYLWSIFSRHFSVAYFAEPMVNYRQHSQSMTHVLTRLEHREDNLKLGWAIVRFAQELGSQTLVHKALQSLANHHGHYLFAAGFRSTSHTKHLSHLEGLILQHSLGRSDARAVRAGIYSVVADDCYASRELSEASFMYHRSLEVDVWQPRIWAKVLLLRFGKIGRVLRHSGKRVLADHNVTQ
jgi:glycosyltransferase involved in cell wall biosynthesis